MKILTAIALVTALLSATPAAGPASAHNESPVIGWWGHIETSDGCSGPIVDSLAHYDTVHACLHHDACWDAARKGLEDARICDLYFLLDLIGGCDKRWPGFWKAPARGACYYKAGLFFNAVVLTPL